MQTYLQDWKAKRAGGRITINARDHLGAARKVPNVDTISVEDGKVTATDKHGERYILTV